VDEGEEGRLMAWYKAGERETTHGRTGMLGC
jgi:hypothetical protein